MPHAMSQWRKHKAKEGLKSIAGVNIQAEFGNPINSSGISVSEEEERKGDRERERDRVQCNCYASPPMNVRASGADPLNSA